MVFVHVLSQVSTRKHGNMRWPYYLGQQYLLGRMEQG